MFPDHPREPQSPPCVLSALRNGSDLAQLDIACSIRSLGVCILGGWGALLKAAGSALLSWEAYGEEERGVNSSQRLMHGTCEARGSTPPRSTPLPQFPHG